MQRQIAAKLAPTQSGTRFDAGEGGVNTQQAARFPGEESQWRDIRACFLSALKTLASDLSGFFRPEKEHEQCETNLIGLDSANSNISYHGS